LVLGHVTASKPMKGGTLAILTGGEGERQEGRGSVCLDEREGRGDDDPSGGDRESDRSCALHCGLVVP